MRYQIPDLDDDRWLMAMDQVAEVWEKHPEGHTCNQCKTIDEGTNAEFIENHQAKDIGIVLPLEEQVHEIIATFKDSRHPMIQSILTALHRSLQCPTS